MSGFSEAIARIDAVNAEDPNHVIVDGASHPAELIYGQRMSSVLFQLYPVASEALRIAVRAQHIRRWSVPRSQYPMDRAGYHKWRNDLKAKHAEIAREILSQCRYSEGDIARVQALIRKENLKRDPEAQALEDTACIVFLRYYAEDFSLKHDDAKLTGILGKTWAKMSQHGRDSALKLTYSPRMRDLLDRALANSPDPS